ncbi:LysR family transcriptional regulator [Pelagibius sp. Alg239-R121]|uniref:LysR family transcriptional regulator n=1 Tax=Pelagibius sp. Alg239-R121 TaxID=2993448 RepID=UPI0024A64016|nr:LysR substrate-binding domain-containing protein [Pelagibius sp. Alg239-R121]
MRFGIRHIRHFTAVAEELHFRRAAERLNMAQPALSRSIKHLEGQIGVQLLERTNRSVSLTKAGEVFLEGCHSMLANMEGAVTQARKASIGEIGHLVIGYTDFAISGALPQILQDFRQRYPGITVEPIHHVTMRQLEGLESEKLDFGFITGPFDRPGYHGVVVQDDAYVVIFYEGHPLAKKKSVTLSELADEPFVLGSPNDWQHFHDHLNRHCRAAGFVPKMVQQAYNSEGIFGLIACEMGITVHTECAYNYVRKGLVVRPIRGLDETLKTMAVWKDNERSPARRVFADFLLEQAGGS